MSEAKRIKLLCAAFFLVGACVAFVGEPLYPYAYNGRLLFLRHKGAS